MLHCLVECKRNQFDCGNGRCLNLSQICNYIDNCANEDISDERNCTHPPGTFCVNLTLTLILHNNDDDDNNNNNMSRQLSDHDLQRSDIRSVRRSLSH